MLYNYLSREILLQGFQFQEKITVLGLEHVKIAFAIYASGMCLTIFIFILETVLGGKKSGAMAKLNKKIRAW